MIFTAVTALAIAGIAAPVGATLLYATNGTGLSRFDDASLGSVTTVPITGLQAGETIVDIDLRPKPTSPGVQTLYAVGTTSRLYTVNPLTGTATQVGAAGAFTLNGTAFGIDFNPTVDRIRLVSNTEQNLRLNPDTGALAATDTALNPAGNIVSIAYDRNVDQSALPTTLFGIDSAAGTLVMIGSTNGTPSSPNGGAITTVGSLGLGTNLNEAIGFDISGSALGTAQATITTGGISRLYSINLATGAATLSSSNGGAIGSGTTPFVGLASSVAPEPSAFGALLVAGGMLIRRGRRRS
jgi:hypothetical protein